MSDETLTIKALAERWHVTPKHVTDRIVRRPDFPPPRVRLSRKTRMWSAADVAAWEAQSLAAMSRSDSR